MKHNSQHFKWRHYEGEIILLCVRWYLRDALSYRDLEEIMRGRGLSVDHTTVSDCVKTPGGTPAYYQHHILVKRIAAHAPRARC